MFSGEFEHNLDDKGRVFLPARHRDELGDTVVLWRGIDGQVNVYPLKTWQAIAANIGRQNQARRAARDMARLVFAGNDCPIDRQGRIVIPQPLRHHAALDANVIIVGVNDHLEIWSQQRWQQVNNRLQAEGSDIAEQLAELGLVL